MPPGEFELCWSRNGTAWVSAGTLMLAGPDPSQLLECSLGQPCVVRLEGSGLQLGDQISVMEVCGTMASALGDLSANSRTNVNTYGFEDFNARHLQAGMFEVAGFREGV